MSKIFFIADTHFGHRNVINHDNRPFNNIEEMDNYMIEKWNKKVSKDDIVYILGDFGWYNGGKNKEIAKKLNGHKHLIRGNHDGNINGCFETVSRYEELKINDRKVILSHYPMLFYNGQYKDAIMLYGHVYNNKDEEFVRKFMKELNDNDIPCKMFNVGVMMTNFEPVTLEELEDI